MTGNLFASNSQTLVNTVNCAGVMGKGVALEFRKMFPDMYDDYRKKCELGLIQLGKLTLYTDTHPWVLNFPTKRHWKSHSRLEDIELGLKELATNYKRWGITSVAMPALGCGHGGLDWNDVKPLIEKYLGNSKIDIEVYEPESVAEKPAEPQYYKVDLFGEPVPPRKKRKRRRSPSDH